MTNFAFLQSEPKFHTFADVAVAAEKILPIDLASSVINCRQGDGVCYKVAVFSGQSS